MRLQIGNGIDNYIQQLGNLEFKASDAIGKAIYAGAKIVSDEIKKNINALPVQDGYHEYVTGIRSIQKKGLIDSFGIASARNDSGYYNVKAGFDGYNGLKSKTYPKGQSNAMIARTFEGGNSHTQKHPFVGPAVRASRDRAERKMAEVLESEIAKVMK